jgi:hypothetical protein
MPQALQFAPVARHIEHVDLVVVGLQAVVDRHVDARERQSQVGLQDITLQREGRVELLDVQVLRHTGRESDGQGTGEIPRLALDRRVHGLQAVALQRRNGRRAFAAHFPAHRLVAVPGDCHHRQRQHGKQGQRKPGNQAEGEQQPRCQHQRLGIAGELLPDFDAHRVGLPVAALVGHAGDQHAGGDADEQGRDLRHHGIADRQHGEAVRGLGRRHAEVDRADDDATEDVDGGDHQPGDGIALDELHGAVHAAVKTAFHGKQVAALASLVTGDLARPQVGIDAHLLARHGIEREARTHLGHSFRALGDHDELHQGDDDEDHEAHHHVAADHQVAEGLDHMARLGGEENGLGGGDVQSQPEHRREQQQRGKGRQADDVRHVHHHHQQQRADHQVHGQQGIQNQHGHRDDDESQHHHHEQGDADVARESGEKISVHVACPPRDCSAQCSTMATASSSGSGTVPFRSTL